MTNIKNDLDDYLLQSDSSRRGFRISLPSISRPKWMTRSEEESSSSSSSWFSETQREWCPSLTRTQRLIGFATCMLLGLLCFILSMMYIPLLLFKARKFALLYTLGSCFFIFSFSFLYGPWNHMKSLVSRERVVPSLVYGLTLVGTLYCALSLGSTLLTVLCAVLQMCALAYITLGAVPGGATGMRFFGSMFKSTVSNTLPI